MKRKGNGERKMEDMPEKKQVRKERGRLMENSRQERIREKRERIRKQRKREKAALILSAVLVVGCLAGVGMLSAAESFSGGRAAQSGNNADEKAQVSQKEVETDGTESQQADVQSPDQSGQGKDDSSQSGAAGQEQDTAPVQITVSAAGGLHTGDRCEL